MPGISKRAAIKAFCTLLGIALLLLNPITAFAQSNPAKRIFIVHSYEQGHVCGEPQAEGILDALRSAGWNAGNNLTVRSYYMDTYRVNAAPEAMSREGQKALEEIVAFKPDLVFVLDDPAARFVMMPLVGRADLSVVFSGMNGQPEMYSEIKKFVDTRARPGANVTGVYETLYVAQSLKVMAQAVPGLREGKVVMITDQSPTGNALTKQFDLELKDQTDVKWEVRRVADWSAYTKLIEELNGDATVKAIYPVALTLPVEGGGRYAAAQIYDWTINNSKKPEMAINYFFARMGLFGGAVVNFSTMGKLAGQKGAKILGGAKAGDLPIENAPDYAIVFNLKRASDLGIEISPRVLAAANAIYKDNLLPLQGRPLMYDPKVKSF